MRNVLVVLVLSCIGLSCGFIVPSGIQEINADLLISADSIHNRDSKPRNMIKNKRFTNYLDTTVITEISPESINTLNGSSHNSNLNNDLYKNSIQKNATIQERSFIYIKQRSKIPYRKNMFEVINEKNIKNNTGKSYILTSPILEEISRRFLTQNSGEKFLNTQLGTKIDNVYNYNFHTNQKQVEKDTNPSGQYLELMKAPILRPYIKTKEKDFVSMEDSLFNFSIGRKLLKDLHEDLDHSTLNSQNDGQPERLSTNTYLNKGQTVSDNSIEDDNLDQIIKQLLKDHVSERKRNYVDHYGLHFCRDCLNKTKKLNSYTPLQIKNMCKCGRKKV